MTADISISPAVGTWVVRVAGAVIGETTGALMLQNRAADPVVFFPQADIATAFLEESDTQTADAIGAASHMSIVAKSGTLKDAVVRYDQPADGFQAIVGYLTFQGEKVAVEQV